MKNKFQETKKKFDLEQSYFRQIGGPPEEHKDNN